MIAACIESLQIQCLDVPCEIIVVDNGSTDQTAERAAEHGAFVVLEERAGLAHARQAGLDAARGEILIFVDADSRIPPAGALQIVRLFDRNPRLVGLSAAFDFHDGRLVDAIGNRLFQGILNPIANFALRAMAKPEVLIGSTMAVRTEALRCAGGVDLRFQFYGEDSMIAQRLHTQGEVWFVREPRLLTSARRYQERGILNVVSRYFLIFALIQFGRIEQARATAQRIQRCDQLRATGGRCGILDFLTDRRARIRTYPDDCMVQGQATPMVGVEGDRSVYTGARAPQ